MKAKGGPTKARGGREKAGSDRARRDGGRPSRARTGRGGRGRLRPGSWPGLGPYLKTLPGWLPPVAIVLWTLAVHGAFLAASVLKEAPVGAFFYGDSVHYLEEARRLVAGVDPLNWGLPFHPPLTAWLLAPLWWLLEEAPSVSWTAKLLMAALSGVTYALFYLLSRERLPGALLICLLMPLSFGELALTSAVSNEVVYRLLLALLLVVGLRWPLLAGALHGLAALTRAEHLLFALALAAAAPFVPRWRRFAALAAPAAVAVVLPWVLLAAGPIRAYNQEHAAEMPEPLPVYVPVSFYGPLNFALAQREAEIFFSRRTLPPPPGQMAVLDPSFPPHNEAIVHGYRLGFAAIAGDPGRFVARTGAKLVHSLRALTYGWTWRDLPKPGRWLRQPVDTAYSSSLPYELFCLAWIGLGAWSLRRQRWFLAVGGVLLLYRLGVNAVFFPYLRSMMVVSPFYLALFWSGLRPLCGRGLRGVLAAVLVVLALFHFITVGGERRYGLAGERTEDGRIIDDRRVVIELASPAP